MLVKHARNNCTYRIHRFSINFILFNVHSFPVCYISVKTSVAAVINFNRNIDVRTTQKHKIL